MSTTVFLGGTCGDSTWRDELISKLSSDVEVFNPVVSDWTPEWQVREDFHKAYDDINVFCITPATNATYSLYEIGFEIGFAANKKRKRLVVCFLAEDNGKVFRPHYVKAIKKIKTNLSQRKIPCFDNLDDMATYINKVAKRKSRNK